MYSIHLQDALNHFKLNNVFKHWECILICQNQKDLKSKVPEIARGDISASEKHNRTLRAFSCKFLKFRSHESQILVYER